MKAIFRVEKKSNKVVAVMTEILTSGVDSHYTFTLENGELKEGDCYYPSFVKNSRLATEREMEELLDRMNNEGMDIEVRKRMN